MSDPRFIPDPTTPFETIVSRALTDMARIEDRVDAVFRVDGSIGDETPPTVVGDGPELFREAEHGEALDDQGLLRDRLDDFVNSLWQLHRRVREFSLEATQNTTLALFSTHQLVLNDWERLEQAVGTDDSADAGGGDPADDADDNGGGVLQTFTGYIKNQLANLSSKIMNLLSTASSLDSWDLRGELSGTIPGFTKGGVELRMTFSK